MALKTLPKACLNFLKNNKSLNQVWKKILANIDQQVFLLDSLENGEILEALMSKEEVLLKEIISLHYFLETSSEDLLKKSYLSPYQIGQWEKDQKMLSESYLDKKALISHKLQAFKAQMKKEREESKKQRIVRPTGDSYTKASILDISL